MAEEKDNNSLLMAELDHIKEELVNYKDREGCWIEKKKPFLESPKFYNLLGDCFAFLFEHGFGGRGLSSSSRRLTTLMRGLPPIS